MTYAIIIQPSTYNGKPCYDATDLMAYPYNWDSAGHSTYYEYHYDGTSYTVKREYSGYDDSEGNPYDDEIYTMTAKLPCDGYIRTDRHMDYKSAYLDRLNVFGEDYTTSVYLRIGDHKNNLHASCMKDFNGANLTCYTNLSITLTHKYGGWTTDWDSTCTATGQRHRVCEGCKATETEVIDAKGHNYVQVDDLASYGYPGYSGQRCTRCGSIIKRVAKVYTVALNHQNGTAITYIKCTYNATVPNVTPPKRTGHTFLGYYEKADGTGTCYIDNAGTGKVKWQRTD